MRVNALIIRLGFLMVVSALRAILFNVFNLQNNKAPLQKKSRPAGGVFFGAPGQGNDPSPVKKFPITISLQNNNTPSYGAVVVRMYNYTVDLHIARVQLRLIKNTLDSVEIKDEGIFIKNGYTAEFVAEFQRCRGMRVDKRF